MSAARYRQALRILERWPTDPSKGENRDIGVLLRKQIAARFKKADQSEFSDPEKCDKMLTSLEKICVDEYKKQYSLSPPLKKGALLNDFEICHMAVSEEGFEQFKQEESKGVFRRAYDKVFGSKTEDSEEKKIPT